MAANRSIEAGRAFMRLSVDDAAFNRGITATEQRLRQFGRSAGSIGAQLQGFGTRLFAGGSAAGAGLGFALRTFADFDDRARTVGAVSQATGADLERLTQQAKDLGASTSFTAAQVSDLQAELARAGFNPGQIIDLTGAVLDLSRATSTESALASGIFASAIRQFGLEADDARRVADGLTVAANKSFNTLESLGESLKFAGPVAADLNMSLEETLAILGVLGNVGIQGSNAGTAVRRLATLGAADAERLGEIFDVDFIDQAGNARRLVDALDDVAKAASDLPTGERARRFNEAFGLLGITGASAIAKNIGSVRELEQALNNSQGAAERTAVSLDAGVGGAGRKLVSAFEGLQIAAGEALGPLAETGAANLSALASSLRDATRENESAVVSFAGGVGAVTAFGAALLALGTSLRLVQFAASGFGSVLSAFRGIGLAVTPVTALASAFGLLGAAVAAYIRADTAASVAVADAEAARPTEFFTDNDRLQASITEIASRDVIDEDGLRQAASAVKALEDQFGPLGIVIDATAGKVENLEQGLSLASAQEILRRTPERISAVQEQLKAIGGTDAESLRRISELESRIRLLRDVAADAAEEVAMIGEQQPSRVTAPATVSPSAAPPAFDREAAEGLAETIATKIEKLSFSDGPGAFGGQDLGARVDGQVVRIAELQLDEQKRASQLIERLIEYVRDNPGLIGG